MQVSSFSGDYLIDCFMLRNQIRNDYSDVSFKAIFSNPEVTKIFHSGDSDVKYLISDFGIVTINMFDTSKAFQFI